MRHRADARVGLRRPARGKLRPAQAEDAHLDLPPQELELLRLRPILKLSGDDDSSDDALRRPALKELIVVGVGIDGGVEQRDDALLPPGELGVVVRLERRAAVDCRARGAAPHELDERPTQLLAQPGPVEAATLRAGLAAASLRLTPVAHDVTRQVEVVVAHLLDHACEVPRCHVAKPG